MVLNMRHQQCFYVLRNVSCYQRTDGISLEDCVGLYYCICWQVRNLQVGIRDVNIADHTVQTTQGLDQKDAFLASRFQFNFFLTS